MKIAFYCEHCWKFLAYDPEREARASAPIAWILCDPCKEREARRRSELQQLVEMWAHRTCAADDCSTTFTPAATQQRFCSDR